MVKKIRNFEKKAKNSIKDIYKEGKKKNNKGRYSIA